jgi:hypothetical protein
LNRCQLIIVWHSLHFIIGEGSQMVGVRGTENVRILSTSQNHQGAPE